MRLRSESKWPKASVTEAGGKLADHAERYQAGIAISPDLLRTETAVLEARTRLLAAIRDQRVAAAGLELAAGTLTADSAAVNERTRMKRILCFVPMALWMSGLRGIPTRKPNRRRRDLLWPSTLWPRASGNGPPVYEATAPFVPDDVRTSPRS
jgi:hypothetical protein